VGSSKACKVKIRKYNFKMMCSTGEIELPDFQKMIQIQKENKKIEIEFDNKYDPKYDMVRKSAQTVNLKPPLSSKTPSLQKAID
jgi:hypothetical protein